MIWRVLCGFLVCCIVAGVAGANEQRDEEARRLYQEGRAAFEQHAYQHAYDAFRRAYLVSQRPALLFNMSSALKELDRPHDAAEELRAYLRVVPDAPDRAEIEQRILTLEESQRILDGERPRPPPEKPAAPPMRAATVASLPRPNPLTAAPPEKPRRRLALPVGLGVGGAVLVAALAAGLAVGLSHPAPAPTVSAFGVVKATP